MFRPVPLALPIGLIGNGPSDECDVSSKVAQLATQLNIPMLTPRKASDDIAEAKQHENNGKGLTDGANTAFLLSDKQEGVASFNGSALAGSKQIICEAIDKCINQLQTLRDSITNAGDTLDVPHVFKKSIEARDQFKFHPKD